MTIAGGTSLLGVKWAVQYRYAVQNTVKCSRVCKIVPCAVCAVKYDVQYAVQYTVHPSTVCSVYIKVFSAVHCIVQ